ncbi:Blp family class II bacteriocin [Crassaminicella profunda]|uniref:Blp family class II bacteriocin n=1 Tax=Crassaminicella profunda TaxID=1286698 RepID=UPI001CA7B4A4|nr:class IIb bacteriocin, lactobin A/cerein 7B family [Crassaminicella profunda]QZY54913.1 class IIb bacteriocin, lactobin A/cerein 7B family [Crassaminicella profunda]
MKRTAMFNDLNNDELMQVNGGIGSVVAGIIVFLAFAGGWIWGKSKPKHEREAKAA